MNFQPYFKTWADDVDKFLVTYFSRKARDANKIAPIAVNLISDFSEFTFGGKRLRAGLVKLGYELAGGKNPRLVLPVSAAAEVLHSALLVHDDIIDRGEVRHNKPTIHIKYSQKLKAKSEKVKIDKKHYGESMAIMAGDFGLYEAINLCLLANLSDSVRNRVIQKLVSTALNTAFGEALDVELAYKKKVTEREVMTVNKFKTAFYTFIGPLSYGALCAGVSRDKLRAIEKYGLPIGIAYQLQDDILGIFGEEKELGKPVASDVREGKSILLYLEALKRGTKRQRKILKKVWGNVNIMDKEVRQTQDVIKETGALDYSIKMAQELVGQGKKAIPKITKNLEHQEILSTLADYMIEREK